MPAWPFLHPANTYGIRTEPGDLELPGSSLGREKSLFAPSYHGPHAVCSSTTPPNLRYPSAEASDSSKGKTRSSVPPALSVHTPSRHPIYSLVRLGSVDENPTKDKHQHDFICRNHMGSALVSSSSSGPPPLSPCRPGCGEKELSRRKNWVQGSVREQRHRMTNQSGT